MEKPLLLLILGQNPGQTEIQNHRKYRKPFILLILINLFQIYLIILKSKNLFLKIILKKFT